MMKTNRENGRQPEFKISDDDFREGDIITCPSDGTKIKWKVVRVNPEDNVIVAKVVKDQPRGEKYPKRIEIAPEAAAGWQKVQALDKNVT